MEPVEIGANESVRFTAVDDWTDTLRARSLHCRPSVSADGLPLYVTGFEFADQGALEPSIATLLEKVTSLRLESGS